MKILLEQRLLTCLLLILIIPFRSVGQVEKEGPEDVNYAIELPGGNNGMASAVAIPPLHIAELPVTIEMWYKPDAGQNEYATLWYNRGESGNTGVQYDRWVDQSKIKAVWYGSAEIPEARPTPGEWNHVALVVAPSRKTLFINGVEFSETGTSFSNYPFDAITYLGWDEAVPNRTLKGQIDEVRFWTVEKTAQELEAMKFEPLNGDEPGLLGYWNFDDQGETATDLTGNGNHGTRYGASYVPSTVFEPMELTGAYASQPNSVVNVNSENLVVLALNLQTSRQKDPLILTTLKLSAAGTDNLNDIAHARLYSSGADSVFSTETLLAELPGSPEEVEFELNMEHALSPGDNFFWITYATSPGATKGNRLDLACQELLLSGGEAVEVTHLTDGQLQIDPDQFVNLHTFEPGLIEEAATSVEGANFASFQQNAIMTYNGYQYVVYWNSISNPCLARKRLPEGGWETIEFTDYRVDPARVADNHYTISMGICASDGTIHLAFDHHNDPLNYKKSVPGLANKPEGIPWSQASFSGVRDYLIDGSPIGNVTYPRFVAKPGGDLIFECRIGWSGDGDSFLWEYEGESGSWSYVGEYLNGTSVGENPYINGLHYDPEGRLHVSWVWRQTPDPLTNHDVYYGYSDDHGRTWRNVKGDVVAKANENPMTLSTPGLKVWTVGTNRGLINQESQAVDSQSGIHILQSYMPDGEPGSSNFWGSRIEKGYLHHIYRDGNGEWRSDPIAPSGRNRSEIAVDENDNLYVVRQDGRIFFASAVNGWKDWVELEISGQAPVMNEGLIDREALLQENVLSYVFAHGHNDGRLAVFYHLLEKKSPGTGLGLNITTFEDEGLLKPVEERLGTVDITGDDLSMEGEVGIRCSGLIETRYAESYTLYLMVSGETKVWLNDQLALETGPVDEPTVYEIDLEPVPSHKNRIRIEGVYHAASARIKLEWASETQDRELVPPTSLYGELAGLPPIVSGINKREGRAIYSYPNPFRSAFYISAPGSFIYRIWDASGRLKEFGPGSERKLVGAELKSGLYFLEVNQNKRRETFKMVKW